MYICMYVCVRERECVCTCNICIHMYTYSTNSLSRCHGVAQKCGFQTAHAGMHNTCVRESGCGCSHGAACSREV